MYCNRCGNYCDDTMKFCNKCGAQLGLNKNDQTQRKQSNFFSYQQPYQNMPVQSARATFIGKLKKTKTLTVIAAIMAIISQIASIIFIIVFINMDNVNMNDPDAWALPAILFLLLLIINLPSFVYFLKFTLKISSLLNCIEINYSKETVEQFISKVNKQITIIIMVINVALLPSFVTIPLGIIQVIASFSILNLKKFYDINRNSIF